MGVGLRPGAKAPEVPPTPYRPRASPRLYTNLVGTLMLKIARPTRWPRLEKRRGHGMLPGIEF